MRRDPMDDRIRDSARRADVPWHSATLAGGALLLAIALCAGCGNRQPIPPEPARPGIDENRRGLWLYHSGDLDGAEENFRRAISFARGVDDLHTQANVLYNLGLVLRDKGQADDALA
ncbi:MAG TPA: tetratricopeptide repeat protein, partial [Planctomycetota bacterium]|nr:tetratricopeptide repeat protein [Planctomycetota bacterium]